MTALERERVFNAIDNASNEHIGLLYKSVAGVNPFTKHAAMLPSKIREETIKKVKEMIDTGFLNFTANE